MRDKEVDRIKASENEFHRNLELNSELKSNTNFQEYETYKQDLYDDVARDYKRYTVISEMEEADEERSAEYLAKQMESTEGRTSPIKMGQHG